MKLKLRQPRLPGKIPNVPPRTGSGARSVAGTKWYSDLAGRYGTRNAEVLREMLGTDRYTTYMAPDGIEKAAADARQYAVVRDIEDTLGGDPARGGAVIGGSVSINKVGSLKRATAVSHDLDISGNIDGASLRPWEPYPLPRTDQGTVVNSWYDRYMSPIEGWFEKPGTKDAGILRRIREMYPDTHANAEVVPWNWKTMKIGNPKDRYKPGVFQQIGDGYSLSPEAGNNLFLGTEINGVPIDIFLTDSFIERTPGSNYSPPEVAMTWKNAYAAENSSRGSGMRPKDSQDFLTFRRFSKYNPVVDPATLKAQFSPPNFGPRILTDEGLPAVYDVETWPGSGVRIPMMMNPKGDMVHPFDPNALRQDAKGGETSAGSSVGGVAPEDGGRAMPTGGPRIVVNPTTFKNRKDALCVAYNEAFRVVMEENEFNPQAEPTEEQRRFFSDTAYAGDEVQLRRTILARICTFDTSVKDPTDEQISEAVEFLETVMQIGAPQSAAEQAIVQRAHDVLAAAISGTSRGRPETEEPPREEYTPEEPGQEPAPVGEVPEEAPPE